MRSRWTLTALTTALLSLCYHRPTRRRRPMERRPTVRPQGKAKFRGFLVYQTSASEKHCLSRNGRRNGRVLRVLRGGKAGSVRCSHNMVVCRLCCCSAALPSRFGRRFTGDVEGFASRYYNT